jgi:actin-related protein
MIVNFEFSLTTATNAGNFHSRNLPTAQREALQKQNSIKMADDLQRQLAKAEAAQANLIQRMSPERRDKLEKENVREMISLMIGKLFEEFDGQREEWLSHDTKMKILQQKLKTMVENIRVTIMPFRGREFESQFKKSVLL